MFLIWLIIQDVLIVKLLQNSGDNLGLKKGCSISICNSLKHRNFETCLISPFYLCIAYNKIQEDFFISLISVFSVLRLLCLQVLHLIHPMTLPRFWHRGTSGFSWWSGKNLRTAGNLWKKTQHNWKSFRGQVAEVWSHVWVEARESSC